MEPVKISQKLETKGVSPTFIRGWTIKGAMQAVCGEAPIKLWASEAQMDFLGWQASVLVVTH